jgi:hypothetical protein
MLLQVSHGKNLQTTVKGTLGFALHDLTTRVVVRENVLHFQALAVPTNGTGPSLLSEKKYNRSRSSKLFGQQVPILLQLS